MSQVGVLATGAGNVTTITLPYIPEYVMLGASDTDIPVQGITAFANGITFQEINDQAAIQAIAKARMKGILGADVKISQVWKLSNGQIALPKGQNFIMKLENAGATTPNIYAYSTGIGSVVVNVEEQSLNPRTNAIVEGVNLLAFDAANYSKSELVFNDGHVESDLSLVELNSLLTVNQNTDADAELAGLTVIDFDLSEVASVKLFAGSGGALSYYTLKIA